MAAVHTYRSIANFGKAVVDRVEHVGRFASFGLTSMKCLMVGTGGFSRARLILPQFYTVGTQSIPVVLIVGAFVGMVLSVEAFEQFRAIGQETRMGVVINLSVVKQIGPVLAAVMIAGRVGGAITAELGTMRVTEQIDAVKVMGVDPVAYLVVPRVLACVVMVPVLTVFSDLMGILGGYLVTVKGYGVDEYQYWHNSALVIWPWDVINGLVKSVFFGLAIGIISCYKGFHTEAGAAGVGRAATDSFVTSFLAIIVINFFAAFVLKHVYHLIYGYGTQSVFG